MRPTSKLVLTAALLSGAACGRIRMPEGDAPTVLPSGSWSALVSGTAASGGAPRGTIRLTPTSTSGEWNAEIEMTAIRHLARHPWYIRSGACGEIAAEDVSSRAVQPIEGLPDRTGSLKAKVRARLDPVRTYHVVLAVSPGDSETQVGCGPLTYHP